jgi:hypothetical protein
MLTSIHTASQVKSNALHLHKALNHHLYVTSNTNSPPSVLCYDEVLCYLSNVIGHGSMEEIQMNIKRYFNDEQLDQAFNHLKNALQYVVSMCHVQRDEHMAALIEQCLHRLADSSHLLSTMEMIENNQLLCYLPTFVTNDWLHMIRNIQDLEKIDTPSPPPGNTMNSLNEQMHHLKAQLSSLHQMVDNVRNLPLPASADSSTLNDQCCLRTYCAHTSHARLLPVLDSPGSSWSPLDVEKAPIATLNRAIPGFIRNPVSSFLVPTAPCNDLTR